MSSKSFLGIFGQNAEARAELLYHQGKLERAAKLYRKAGNHRRAAAIFAESGNHQQAIESYRQGNEPAKAAELLEKAGDFDAAASAYEEAEEWGKAARLWERAEDYARAAELYARVERYAEAGQCYARSNQHDKAGEVFARAGNHPAAADAFLAAESYLQAGEHYLEAGNTAAALDALSSVEPAAADYSRACQLLMPLLIEEGHYDQAAARLEPLPVAAGLYWRGRLAEARRELQEARRLYQQLVREHGGYRDATRRLARLEERPEPEPDAVARRPAAPPAAAAGREPTLAELVPTAAALADLPFTITGEIEPWWPGCELCRAEDRRSQGKRLLLVVPLSALGPEVEAFRRAAAQIQALKHPSVLRLDEVYLTEERVILCYEPFAGDLLSRQLAGPWRPTPNAALHLLMQASEALSAAHKLGLVHGWLSPRTILIDDAEQIRLIGFGLERLRPAGDPTTVAYRAPELRRDLPPAPATDMFSLGLLGVELLGALLPADWSRGRIEPEEVRWPEGVAELAGDSLREALVRCLAREPIERPSAEVVARTLNALGLMPGQVLQGRYEIQGELGRGGMSRVYRAYDRVMAEEVAIKTLLASALRHPDEERRLLREVQICRKISHPNVVRVHDLGQFPGGVFITMELLDGEGLDRLIRRAAPLPLDEVRRIVQQIALALVEAHRLEIVHRDLKPGNVILVGDRVKVLDFGIARMGAGAGQPNVTRTGEVIGSPLYMAPEQLQGKPVDGACDLYALGVITFAMLTGREPFLGEDATAVALQHLRDAPPDPRELRPDLPPAWAALVDQMLAKPPADRPTAADLARAVGTLPA
ncbi:MAG: hypothetical protein D6696_16465 [Acidobacteria bacterium]|nr:MAG: hypothetical protein D6696_16465 [Acidobacteriota bacterium]